MTTQIWVGVDPGGEGNFGVAILREGMPPVLKCVNCADEAVALISERPAGAGVDAPLWWTSGRSSFRMADDWIRRTYKGSVVLALNSLWGAALVQGMMFVARLRQKFPGVPVTETHPKATAVALGEWGSPQIQAFGCPKGVVEHVRDAYLSAIAAREGFSGRWTHDLSLYRYPSEQDPRAHWLAPVHYFWPLE